MITETSVSHLDPDITVVRISGRLHLGNLLAGVENAIKKLIAEGARKMVVDLEGLDYIDSAGIGMLVSCYGEIDAAGGSLRLAGARGTVAKAFGITKLDRLISFDADVSASANSLA